MRDASTRAKSRGHHDCLSYILLRRTRKDSSLGMVGNAVGALRRDGYSHSDQLPRGEIQATDILVEDSFIEAEKSRDHFGRSLLQVAHVVCVSLMVVHFEYLLRSSLGEVKLEACSVLG